MSKMLAKMAEQLNCEVAKITVERQNLSLVPTPSSALTWALCGGIVRNRLNIFAGDSGSGKSTLSIIQAAIIQQQTPEGVVVIIDTEYYYNNQPSRVARLATMGLDLDRTLIRSTNDPNEAFKLIAKIEGFCKDGIKICACIVDSLGGVLPSSSLDKIAEGDAESGGNSYGGTAKLIASTVKAALRVGAEQNVTFFMVQHAMDDLTSRFPKKIIKGGQTLRLESDTMCLMSTVDAKDSRFDISGRVADSKTMVYRGKTIRVKVEKCRDGVEGRTVTFPIDFINGSMMNDDQVLFDLGAAIGVVYHPEGKVKTWGFKTESGEEITGYRDVVVEKIAEHKEYLLKCCLKCSSVVDITGGEEFVNYELETGNEK